MATYKIHPGIGIARLGNSDDRILHRARDARRTAAGLRRAGQSALSGRTASTPVLVTNFRDADGRIKRQAARFQVFVYDDASPEGRPLKIGDPVEGGGNAGTLIDIEWQVYVANKKACWYEFDTTQGEHGYPDGYPRRNADVTDRDRLIIDPGPRIVNHTTKRRASFDRSGEGNYATTFPPPDLTPFSIDTLGEMVADDSGRLLVLGGHGRSGSEKSGPGEPHIANYANNDGWYDDTSDGPVMARLMMYAENVTSVRYVDVEYPAWVIVGYPRYVPVVLDMVTMDEVLYDLFVREFADDTALYGAPAPSTTRTRVDYRNEAALRAMAGRPAHLEPGVQAVVLPRHLADPVSARPVPFPVQHPRPVELPARPAAARHVRSVQALGRAEIRLPRAAAQQAAAGAAEIERDDAPKVESGAAGRLSATRTAACADRSLWADAALSVRPAAACRRGERVQDRGPHQQPHAQPAADADAVRRQLPDQRGAVEVPAPHRLSAVHSPAMGATAASSTRSTKAG